MSDSSGVHPCTRMCVKSWAFSTPSLIHHRHPGSRSLWVLHQVPTGALPLSSLFSCIGVRAFKVRPSYFGIAWTVTKIPVPGPTQCGSASPDVGLRACILHLLLCLHCALKCYEVLLRGKHCPRANDYHSLHAICTFGVLCWALVVTRIIKHILGI